VVRRPGVELEKLNRWTYVHAQLKALDWATDCQLSYWFTDQIAIMTGQRTWRNRKIILLFPGCAGYA
jgi:hypothetical protein